MKAGTVRRTAAAAAAGVLVSAIALTGTLAWTSISQRAINVKVVEVEVNPGGRLHDDFDGENKDVYVENFTDPDDPSSAPIFVRVRLREYMETGDDAGVKTVEEGAERQATPLVPGTDMDTPTGWTVHIPDSADDPFHDYWTWELGGSTVYMPTFNRNKDSLSVDVNGTYDGTDATDNIHYDDYTAWTDGDTKEGCEYYDADDDADDEYTGAEGEVPGGGGTVNVNYTKSESEVTHTAAATQDAEVLTMAEWQEMGSPTGAYWVWDTDGWAYWAMPLQPGTATGCLLTGVRQKRYFSENCYYAIEVVGQFATAGDWGTAKDEANGAAATGFYIDGVTDDALALLDRAAYLDVGDVVTLDGIDFVALDVDEDSNTALLLSKYILEERAFDAENAGGTGSSTNGDNKWDASPMRTYLNSTESGGWLYGKTQVQAAVVETTLYTQTEYNNQTMIETKDKIFLLSQADVAGTYNNGEGTDKDVAVTNDQYYSIGKQLDVSGISALNSSWIAYHTAADGSAADWWYLRSPRNGTNGLAYVGTAGLSTTAYGGFHTDGGVRPALVVDVGQLPMGSY